MPSLCIEECVSDPPASCYIAGPIFKKMKILKKFKRRMGLANRGNPATTNSYLPPLTFHAVCGDNVRISADGKVARRAESFCKGIALSARPVRVGERVCLRLLEISTNWSGVIRFGFTAQDPAGLRDSLPKYACPDLTNKPGYWAKALSERFASQGSVVFYYVTQTGDVHFGIDGEERGVFFGGVDTRSPLWSLIDVYGNSTAVEYLDPLAQMNNRTHIVNNLGSSSSSSHPAPLPSPPTLVTPSRNDSSIDRLQPSMAQLTLSTPPRVPDFHVRHHNQSTFTPFPFHRVRGRNVHLNEDRSVATRNETEYSHGYVFGGRPLVPGERLVVQVLSTEAMYVGALAFGLTAANPAGLEPADLPEDCDSLLDRPEYWVVSKDVASSPLPGDELAFSLTQRGEVTFSKNGSSPRVFMHVDHTLQLWPFFDVYGNTGKIRSLGVTYEASSPQRNIGTSSPSRQMGNIARSSHSQLPRSVSLVVNLPPDNSPAPAHPLRVAPLPSSSTLYNGTYIEPISANLPSGDDPSFPVYHECTVCYEKPVDSVLYMCGHMCMCYECALQQWRGRGGGQCPMCRAVIKDVIRTYRS